METIEHLTSRFSIKGKTNINDLAKQYFEVARFENGDAVSIIRKLCLVKDLNYYESFIQIKKLKDSFLVEKIFSIKMKTLSKVINTILNINPNLFSI